MTGQSLLLLLLYTAVLIATACPLGLYMAKVAEVGPIRWLGWLHRLELLLYRAAGIEPTTSMGWKAYTMALLVFNTLGTLFAYGVQRLQQWLPFNPQGLLNISPDSSFNTAISFASNTSWQGYAGESTMSSLTQMLAINGQEFLSAATGIAVGFAFIRSLASGSTKVIGNFWIDLVRVALYVLLPIAVLFAAFLMSQGVIQNFHACKNMTLIDPITYSHLRQESDGQALRDAQGNPVTETLVVKTQTLALARSPPRQRSSCSAATAEGSSMPTPPILTKTQRHWRILSKWQLESLNFGRGEVGKLPELCPWQAGHDCIRDQCHRGLTDAKANLHPMTTLTCRNLHEFRFRPAYACHQLPQHRDRAGVDRQVHHASRLRRS